MLFRSNLTDEEIDKMMKEAEANKEADEKRKEEAELRNETEQLVFTAEKAVKDLGDKVKDDEKKEIEALIEDAKKALEAKEFNQYYHDTPILREENMELLKYRLVLVESIAKVLAKAMSILGITLPERM